MEDPYRKLRPVPPTESEELCACLDVPKVYLAHILSKNPIHCATCCGEVAPEILALPAPIVDLVANWNTVYGAIFKLWLNSGPYELWSYQELVSPESAVNTLGLAAAAALSEHVPCFYLWFWHSDSIIQVRPAQCPVCGGTATANTVNGFNECSPCNIYL